LFCAFCQKLARILSLFAKNGVPLCCVIYIPFPALVDALEDDMVKGFLSGPIMRAAEDLLLKNAWLASFFRGRPNKKPPPAFNNQPGKREKDRKEAETIHVEAKRTIPCG
jgi:hypothetical protein